MEGTTVTIVLLAACLVALVWLLGHAYRTRHSTTGTDFETVLKLIRSELVAGQAESILSLRDSIDNANRLLNERLAEGNRTLDERMAFMGEIENKLGQLEIQAKNIETVGKNIQSLSQLLRPPKVRGGVGEVLLDNLLAQILPKALYDIQYRYAGGQRVDAVIKLGDRLLPVDAKFPLETYEQILAAPEDRDARKEFTRTFRKHIDDICGKYLKPDENTTDFAIMFIPSEAVYYQFVSQDERSGFDYALEKKVIPSSPGHLYGFLASVSSLYSALHLDRAGLAEGGRLLAAGLNELAGTLAGLRRLHERMESSLRALSLSFEKARYETGNLEFQLERLRKPVADEEKVTDEETNLF
jgi:DNA recombination protein RmuC